MNLKVSNSEEFVYVDSVDFKLTQKDIDAIKSGSDLLLGTEFESLAFLLKGGVILNSSDDELDEDDEDFDEDDYLCPHEVEYCEVFIVNKIGTQKPQYEFFLRVVTKDGFLETDSTNLDDYHENTKQ